MKSSKILLVEDDALLCTSLEQLLKASGYQVECFQNTSSVLHFLSNNGGSDLGKTLLLIDVHLGGESGIDVQKAVRSQRLPLPCVFMSAHQNAKEVNQAWLDGALNFLFKPFTPKELLIAIEKAFDTHRLEMTGTKSQPSTPEEVLQKFSRLTPRQKEVLQLVAVGLSNTVIAARLGISARTVKMHRESMMHRFGFAHVADLVRFHDACKHLF